MIRWRTKLPFCQFVYLCSIAANPFWQSYISAACADRQSSICLASQEVLRTGWWHAPMLHSNGSLGCCPPQAWHTEIARDPAPCSLPGLMKNRQVDMTKINSLLQKCQTSLCPGHEWLAIVVLWFHWNVFILATATSTFEQRNSARNGSDRASDWSYQDSTSCHMWKKRFFLFLSLLLWKISL